MCLHELTPCNVSSLKAWKVFAFDFGKLSSPFLHSNPNFLTFPTNEIVECEDDNHFYAFEEFQVACHVATTTWNYKLCEYRLVLPVTLIDVRFTGFLVNWNHTHDHYRTYMARKIQIHDAPEHREKYKEELRRRIVGRDQHARKLHDWLKQMSGN